MTAIADRPTAFEVRNLGRTDRRAIDRLSLRATEDGWSLIAPGGSVVYRGLGLASRRECLRYAHDLGVLAVLG
jgi:hypothetical protein